LGPLVDPSIQINEDGSIDTDAIQSIAERQQAQRRFYFSEIGDAEAEAVRQYPGVQAVYERASHAKFIARSVVSRHDGDELLPFLRRELEYLAEDAAAEVRKLDRPDQGV
jgi:hypothetical protein